MMKIKVQTILTRPLLLTLLLMSLLVGPGLAQSPTPLADLSVALWPEYDRPEVLVIFRGRVADDVSLPAQVSFTLPPTIQALHAIAYLEQGTLVNVPDYDFVEGADNKVLTFTTPSRQFQFEYYSADLLSINGDVRTLFFSFTASADVADFALELQQPTTAQAFTSDPPPSATEVGQDGLVYALYTVGAISAGNSYSLQASYTRSTNKLSAGVNIPAMEQMPVEVGDGGLRDYLGLILIAAGVLLLIAAFGYWFWSQRSVVVPEPAARGSSPRPRRSSSSRQKQTGAPPSAPSPAADKKLAAYCHQCGTKFREDGQFCHACGAERRAE
jgi:hypothetical protein